MNNYLFKIEPGKKPTIINATKKLEREYFQREVEGEYDYATPHEVLKTRFPSLSIIYNTDGELFELPFNECATRMRRVLDGKILGSAMLVTVRDGVPSTFTAYEVDDVAEVISNELGIEIIYEHHHKGCLLLSLSWHKGMFIKRGEGEE